MPSLSLGTGGLENTLPKVGAGSFWASSAHVPSMFSGFAVPANVGIYAHLATWALQPGSQKVSSPPRSCYCCQKVDSFEEVAAHVADGISAFRRRYQYPFLVRKPRTLFEGSTLLDGSGAKAGELSLEYHTETVKRDEDELMPWQWWLVAIKKKPENPFPEHISVGRATNCDVVLRFSYVSKLHARFLLECGVPRAIVDCDSSNGLRLNGQKLAPYTPAMITFGDRLTFGSLDVRYLDPEGMFELLRARGAVLRKAAL